MTSIKNKSALSPWANTGLLLVALVWGLTFPMIKTSVEHVPPLEFVALRFGLSALIMSALLPFEWKRIRWSTVLRGSGAGLFLLAGYGLQTLGLKYTSASNGAFLTGLSVVLVPCLGFLCYGQKITIKIGTGVALAFAGLSLLSGGSLSRFNFGDWCVVGGAAAFAAQILAVARFDRDEPPMAITFFQMLAVALGAAVWSRVSETPLPITSTEIPWGVLAFTAAFASCGAFYLQSICQKHTTATHAALIFSTEPLWGALAARVLLSESINLTAYFGGLVLLLGVIVVEAPIPDLGEFALTGIKRLRTLALSLF